MADLFNLSDLTPTQAGRVNASLEKRFNFASVGVMTLRAWLESQGADARKWIGDHSCDYSRTRFNRMNHAEQRAYEARLARASYNVGNPDRGYIAVPKIVFDVLNVATREA